MAALPSVSKYRESSRRCTRTEGAPEKVTSWSGVSSQDLLPAVAPCSGDILLDPLRQPFTFSARTKIPPQLFIPRCVFHPFKPVGQLPSFLVKQMLDGLLDGFEPYTVNLCLCHARCYPKYAAHY